MLLSRKRLYRIKKTKEQSRRRRKNRNKKNIEKKRGLEVEEDEEP